MATCNNCTFSFILMLQEYMRSNQNAEAIFRDIIDRKGILLLINIIKWLRIILFRHRFHIRLYSNYFLFLSKKISILTRYAKNISFSSILLISYSFLSIFFSFLCVCVDIITTKKKHQKCSITNEIFTNIFNAFLPDLLRVFLRLLNKIAVKK